MRPRGRVWDGKARDGWVFWPMHSLSVARFGFHTFFLWGTVDRTAQGNDAVEEGKMLSFRDSLPI